MALSTTPTLTPSGYLTFSTPPVPPSDPSGTNIPYVSYVNTVALPAGSSPATALIQNLGPEPAWVALTTATASTTGTGSAGSKSVTLTSGASVAVGQAVIGTGIAQGTTVAAISGTALTLSSPSIAAVSGTLNFVAQVTSQTGILVTVFTPIALAYVASGFISALCVNGASRSVLNVTVGV